MSLIARSGCSRRSLPTSSSSVVCVSGATRPSERCSARRRSTSAACSSAAIRSRASGDSSAWLENTSCTPNSRWITPSCTSRARSIRSCSWRARACWLVASRAWVARAAVLPSAHSAWRSLALERRAARPAVRQDDPEPAPGGRHRRAHQRRLAEQVAVLVGDLRRVVVADLDHAVLLERLARDRRRLDGQVRILEQLEVDPVGARGVHPPACVVVAEDHRPVHRRDAAGRLAETAVEVVGRAVDLHARQQLDERLERVDRDGGL